MPGWIDAGSASRTTQWGFELSRAQNQDDHSRAPPTDWPLLLTPHAAKGGPAFKIGLL